MEKEKQITSQNEEAKYYDKIPPEILENMTPEIRQQYFLWDEMLKRQIQLYPEMLFPLIKEIFSKEYPDGTSIKMLSTEYVVSKVYEYGEKRIESVRSDLLIQVGRKDMYHMECQMKQGGDIAVRMLEYDMNIALVHGLKWVEPASGGSSHKHRLQFPKSAILYLDNTEKTPDAESCIMIFPDGTEYEYRIPILKVQRYTPGMIEEKGLNLLFPFLPIRFRRRFETIWKEKNDPAKFKSACKKMETLKKDLTKFIADCIIIINREEQNGTLSMNARTDAVEFMAKACDHLFSKEPQLLREVHEVMEPAIKLVREELQEEIDRKEETLKLVREELQEEIDRKEEALKLVREELQEEIDRKEETLKLVREEIDRKEETLKLVREEIDRKEETIKLVREKLEEEIERRENQLDRNIENYIYQCKEEGKNMLQTEQMLQRIFSLGLPDTKEKLEKYW